MSANKIFRKMIRRRSSLTTKTRKFKGAHSTHSKSFKRLIEWTFNEAGTNKSGNNDREEI